MYLPKTFNVFTKNVRGFQGKGWGGVVWSFSFNTL